MSQITRNPLTLGGTLILIVLLLAAAFAPYLVYSDPTMTRLSNRLIAPNAQFWLGTDQFGRDIASRVMFGSRVSLLVGVCGVALAAIVGVLVGAVAGWAGGRADNLIMRAMDLLLAFPTIILAIALAVALGPGLDKVIIVIAFSRFPQFVRIVRASVLAVREADFVQAARALGRSQANLVLRHVLPNCITPIVVYSTFSVATAINTEAALSFLGLGVQPPVPSWGNMLSDARQYMLLSPTLAIAPGMAITITVLAFNLIGDGLRDLLDPRSRGAT